MTEPTVDNWDMSVRLAADRVLRAIAHHTAPPRQAKVALLASAALSIATAVEPNLPNDLLVLEKLLKVGAIGALLKDVADNKEPSDAAIAARMEALLPLDRLDELATGQHDLLRALTRQHTWQQQMLRLQEADATTGAALLAAIGEATGDLAFVREQLARGATAAQVERLERLISDVLPRLSSPVRAKYNLPGDYRGATLYFESTINVAPPAPEPPPAPPPFPAPGVLPAPAALPPGSRCPYTPNPLFTGREQELLALAELLGPSDERRVTSDAGDQRPTTHDEPFNLVTRHSSFVTILTGLGGVGKTQLAVEFAHRYGRFYHSVHWLSLAEPAAVAAEAIACGEALGLPLDGRPVDEAVALVRRAWAEATPRLLIFDNCEEPALLRAWRPPPGGARLLVTSRHSSWPPEMGAAVRPLPPLPRADSLALLRRYLAPTPRRESDADLGRVAAAVGDLPLALALAGHYLARYRSQSIDAYLAALAAAGDLAPIGRDAFSPTDHPLSLRRTFAVSYDRLRPAAGDDDDEAAIKGAAVALLARAACLAPGEPIPAALLPAALAADPPALADEARERLLALGLLEADEAGESFRLHRLLVRFVEGEISRQDAEEEEGAREEAEGPAAARAAVERAVIDLAYEQNMAGDPRALRAWDVHLRHVTDAARDRDDDPAATLCTNLGYYLDISGDLAGARPYYERALAIRELVLGPNHPDTALSLNNLGALLDSMGDLAGARPYYERALAISERVLGPEHPDTATSLNNLGYLLRAQGDLAGARPYFERALEIYERVLGPEHPDTALSLNNLGALLDSMGDLAGARPYYERALAIRERVLGPEHPDTATSLNNLGGLLDSMGDLAGARPYLERALAISERVLGPNHPDTALSLNNLGALLDSMGDLAGARPYYERALAISERVLGPEHPDTATSLNNLGFLLRAQGDLAGARPYYERALAIRERVLGPEHPDTALSLNNLGGLLDEEGDDEEALTYYRRALDIRERVLGPDHPDTASSLHNTGALLFELGRPEEARPLLERALAIRTAKLGPNHLSTRSTLGWLAALPPQ